MNIKIQHILAVSVTLVLASFNIISFAQDTPTTPNVGGIDTPFVVDPGDSDQQNPNPNPNPNPSIPVEEPLNPTISSEEIVEDTGETLPVEQDGTDFNLQPGPDATPDPASQTGTPAAANTGSTVRSGGLEVGLAILFVAAIGGLYYYYRKNNKGKSALKTQEKKLKY